MQSLPSELKHLIVELSSGSPASLAALARTHTSFQREAEKALYDTISIFIGGGDSLKCMEILATNPKKAALVHFLIIEFSHATFQSRKVMFYLSKSLINMHSLSDFRVRSCPGDEVEMKGLNEIVCGSHFQLHTFYFDDVPNIFQIIKSQTKLQILGLYLPRNRRHILKTLRELHNAQLFLPIIVTFGREGFTPYPYHISIFPMFYSVDRRATIPQVLAQSFGTDQDIYHTMAVSADDLRGLSIYLIDSSDIPSISALVKNMAVSFPQIRALNLLFEHRCEIPPQEIKDGFSFFSNFREVNTYVW